MACIFVLFERVVSPADGALQIRQQHVDPAGAVDLDGRPAAFALEHGMGMTSSLETTKGTQAVAESSRFWCQPALGPVGDRLVVESAHQFDDGEGRMIEMGIGL